jgi:hypothetical protein
MAAITINEGLSWLKTLRARHGELVALRNQNAEKETRFYGANADKSTEKVPVYDVKALDRLIGGVAKEIRLLDAAIKRTNATTTIGGYDQNEDAIGVIE